jgi:hypothetical protein
MGLPVGVHFSADLGDERTLLELAYELEEARPFPRIQDAVKTSAPAVPAPRASADGVTGLPVDRLEA